MAQGTKAVFSCYTNTDSIERVKVLAGETDIHIGDLLSLIIDYGVERLSVDKLRAWAAKQPNRKGATGGGLKKDEKAALNALDSLVADEQRQGSPAFRFGTADVASKAGMRIALAHSALASLKQRGLVGSMAEPGPDGELMVDQWGRPTKASWWKAEHLKVFEAERDARLAALRPLVTTGRG